MLKLQKYRFAKDEDGAVTVDWVVLTAAVTGLAALGVSQTIEGTNSVSEAIETNLSERTVN